MKLLLLFECKACVPSIFSSCCSHSVPQGKPGWSFCTGSAPGLYVPEPHGVLIADSIVIAFKIHESFLGEDYEQARSVISQDGGPGLCSTYNEGDLW